VPCCKHGGASLDGTPQACHIAVSHLRNSTIYGKVLDEAAAQPVCTHSTQTENRHACKHELQPVTPSRVGVSIRPDSFQQARAKRRYTISSLSSTQPPSRGLKGKSALHISTNACMSQSACMPTCMPTAATCISLSGALPCQPPVAKIYFFNFSTALLPSAITRITGLPFLSA
jgi:hypothetical protein